MKVTLSLPDELVEHYQAEVNGTDTLEAILADRLARALQLHPAHRYLILTDGDLAATEKELGDLPLRNTVEFRQRLHRLAKIRFGEHELSLTPGQLEELAYTAQKQGKPVAQLLQETWARFGQEWSNYVPGAR